jgi:ABC-type dipeptide/oligopeptide/nickel transport system ATPase component
MLQVHPEMSVPFSADPHHRDWQRWFEGQFHVHARLVRTVIWNRLGRVRDPHRVEELAAETWARAVRITRQGGFDRARDFRPWVCGIAANVCREHLRQASSSAGPLLDPDELADPLECRRAQELLEMVEIRGLEHALAGTLSYGQRKLVEIARALLFAPKLLLLDEPFAGINPPLQNRILGYLKALREGGVTLFLIDHEMRILLDVCETVLAIDAGEVIASGPPEEIRRNPRVLAAYF